MAKKNHYWKKSQYAYDGLGTGRRYRNENIPYETICDICAGDNYAMETLVKKFEKSVWRWAKEIADTEFGLDDLYGYEKDMTQDIWDDLQKLLIKKFEIKDDKRETENKFLAYVEKAAKNFLRNEIRKEEPQLRNEVCVDPNTIDNSFRHRSPKSENEREICIWKIEIPVKDKRLIKILEKGLSELKERHRKVLELAIVMDYGHDVIADLLQLEKKSVDNYLSEAIKILKAHTKDADSK
ncbi:MAG: sigma-70 family RNA polymerase sigma factor [Lachnospiraceae bacterium]|nr:sigma-70 family RNA polymerase sigma factor [Lachnospiraceae bacterium]